MTGNQNNKVTILDCTLRDGGYFNNWQFDKKFAKSLVTSLNRAGVNIIEIGYKSSPAHKSREFEGLFRYCPESQLSFLKEHPNAEYACMIDAKEFLKGDNRTNPTYIRETIPPAEESVFDWIRVATYVETLESCEELISIIKELGYKVSLNLMGTSLLSETELEEAVKLISKAEMDVFYFSDSFGNLNPNDIKNCISLIRRYYHGKIGIHTHDNNGLAFPNTLYAIQNGIDFIDCTVMGMGRGAGNLKTEQILLYLYFKKNYSELNPFELLEIMETQLVPMHHKYHWGWDFTYMLSALQNIHPTYCMNLRATNQYTIEQVSAILNRIETSQRKKFDQKTLIEAIDLTTNQPPIENEPLSNLPHYNPKKEDCVLVVATGPSVDEYRSEIVQFIKQHQPFVIECNPKDASFEDVTDRYLIAILNWVRLKKRLETSLHSQKPIVTGLRSVPEAFTDNSHLLSCPCHVKKDAVEIGVAGLTLPAYVVGMYSVGLALLSQPNIIYLAGFDGYPNESDPRHQDMNKFWQKLDTNCQIVSITPTTYPVDIKSIFTLIS